MFQLNLILLLVYLRLLNNGGGGGQKGTGDSCLTEHPVYLIHLWSEEKKYVWEETFKSVYSKS